jgi:4-amino-4-deoxy-L-arabinose transferase-like glycosyltransferase
MSDQWSSRIRAAFWVTGSLLGIVLAYTGRYFINSDAPIYIEMGEAFLAGNWWGLVNFTFSPVYAVLMAAAQTLLKPDRLSELQVLRGVNVLCLLAAMGACDLFTAVLKKEWNALRQPDTQALPWPAVCLVSYSLFLVAALVMIRVRLMNPDMLVFAVALICMVLALKIGRTPEKLFLWVLLGVSAAVGYLTKAFFFLFSPMVFLLAWLSALPLKKSITRAILAAVVMLVVSAPLIVALSYRKGGFSYGEGGRHLYALTISGQGDPIFPPRVISERPRALSYNFDVDCTRPGAFDVCYFTIGFQPKYNRPVHFAFAVRNAGLVFTQNPWLALLILWFAGQLIIGSFRVWTFRPLHLSLVLIASGIWGTALFCLISMEPRYVAPFVYLGFMGLVVGLRYPATEAKPLRRATWSSVLLSACLLGVLAHSAVDQSLRGLVSTQEKASYQEAFSEEVAVRNLLLKKGLAPKDPVGIVGNPPMYWARLAHVRILGEMPDAKEFMQATTQDRAQAARSMKDAGFKALIGKGRSFRSLHSEGWEQVPGTRDYYVKMLSSARDRPTS